MMYRNAAGPAKNDTTRRDPRTPRGNRSIQALLRKERAPDRGRRVRRRVSVRYPDLRPRRLLARDRPADPLSRRDHDGPDPDVPGGGAAAARAREDVRRQALDQPGPQGGRSLPA